MVVLNPRRHDGLQLDSSAPRDLVVHQELRVAALLERFLVEVFRDAREVDVIPGEVRVHGMVDVGDVILDVDLLVDGDLALLGEVRGAREGVGAVIGDGVRIPRLHDGLRWRCSGGWEVEVRQRGTRT